MSRIYLSPPDITELEEQRVVAAIRSGWVAPLGPEVDGFERDLAEYTGRRHAVALSSGTAALHLALVHWKIGPGDFIPTSTMTFAATANAISYTGATPVFVDSDPLTGNIDVELLDQAIEDLRAQGKRVPAVVPVDLLGKCADYESIQYIAEKRDVRVLLDSAESLGATRNGIRAGECGDISIISFNGNKIMTTSGGGMLLTDDGATAEHVRFLATQAREPAIHYEHKEIGYNYRMSNLLAALGRAQLERLDSMIKRRRVRRAEYAALFSAVNGVEIFGQDGDSHDNCWLTAVLVDPTLVGWSGSELMTELAAQEIEARPLWKPMHLQPVFADNPAYLNGSAEQLFKIGVTLPSGSALSDADFDRVLGSIDSFLSVKS